MGSLLSQGTKDAFQNIARNLSPDAGWVFRVYKFVVDNEATWKHSKLALRFKFSHPSCKHASIQNKNGLNQRNEGTLPSNSSCGDGRL